MTSPPLTGPAYSGTFSVFLACVSFGSARGFASFRTASHFGALVKQVLGPRCQRVQASLGFLFIAIRPWVLFSLLVGQGDSSSVHRIAPPRVLRRPKGKQRPVRQGNDFMQTCPGDKTFCPTVSTWGTAPPPDERFSGCPMLFPKVFLL